jgi:hypothetical protein
MTRCAHQGIDETWRSNFLAQMLISWLLEYEHKKSRRFELTVSHLNIFISIGHATPIKKTPMTDNSSWALFAENLPDN